MKNVSQMCFRDLTHSFMFLTRFYSFFFKLEAITNTGRLVEIGVNSILGGFSCPVLLEWRSPSAQSLEEASQKIRKPQNKNGGPFFKLCFISFFFFLKKSPGLNLANKNPKFASKRVLKAQRCVVVPPKAGKEGEYF